MKDLYFEKPKNYFSNIRYDILELIKCNNCKILEIGCGTGATLMELKRLCKANYIAGVDIVDLGQSEKLDKFILGDIEIEELNFPDKYFDIIICADVLEHLKDPWSTVNKLKKYLKDNGVIIASIPNIREIRTLLSIVIKGDFKYADSGILDKTHLRFFCKKNIIELFKETGFKLEKINNSSLSPKRFFLIK
ncbi:MAG: class I SAM-dependent methyltransferase [Desulfurella sp.]